MKWADSHLADISKTFRLAKNEVFTWLYFYFWNAKAVENYFKETIYPMSPLSSQTSHQSKTMNLFQCNCLQYLIISWLHHCFKQKSSHSDCTLSSSVFSSREKKLRLTIEPDFSIVYLDFNSNYPYETLFRHIPLYHASH